MSEVYCFKEEDEENRSDDKPRKTPPQEYRVEEVVVNHYSGYDPAYDTHPREELSQNRHYNML